MLNLRTLLYIAIASFTTGAEASQLVQFNNYFNKIEQSLDQYEDTSEAPSGLIIKFNTNGKYYMFETNNCLYRGGLFNRSNSNPENIYNAANFYFKTSDIIFRGKNVLFNDFIQKNSSDPILFKSEKADGFNLIFNCKNEETIFGNIACDNISSLNFNNTKFVGMKSINNLSNNPVNLICCGGKVSIRDAGVDCITYSPLIIRKGLNNVGF